jgi:tryptophanyl-tRNA synthetase
MYTDPTHIRAADPGTVEGNVVFTYLDAFAEAPDMVDDLKARYRQGGVGDSVVKRDLDAVLQALLAPIRERRARYAADPGYVMHLLRQGTFRARERTQATLEEVRSGLGLFSL